MSISSDQHSPSNPNDSAEMVISTSWDELTSAVAVDTRCELSDWLESQLDELESELSQFTSANSQFSGRR